MSKTLLASALAVVLLAAPAVAHEYNVGKLHIGHPWARATPKGAQVGGGYMTITNNGSEPERLLGGSAAFAKEVQVHEMKMDNGVMKMRHLSDGLEIKPGATVTLEPGGYHVMFTGLKEPLKQGERMPATLDFAKAGKVKVDFVVEGIGAMHGASAGGGMPGMAHDMPGMRQ